MKRSYVSQKGSSSLFNEKRDLPTTSKQTVESNSSENDTGKVNIPLIRLSENAKFLPRYTTILTRSSEDGVNMDDLDQLQQDFERLLSACSLRHRFLINELESMDKDDKRDKKGKTSAKRKRTDDKGKAKETKNGTRPIKKHYNLPVNSLLGDAQTRPQIPKINLANNDTSDKFWASVEPYCAAITNYHVSFLDKLIEECSQEIDLKIPELGEYYPNVWNETTLNSEQDLGISSQKSGSGVDLKKNGLTAVIDNLFNLKAQRPLVGLIEETISNFPSVTSKVKPADFNFIKTTGGPICMERRLRENLVQQGILSTDDLPEMTTKDEILQEIKKCQQELSIINEYNVEELNRLKNLVNKDLRKQEIAANLSKVDNQILELYNKVLLAKQKLIQQAKDEELDKAAFTKALKEFEVQTDTLLKQQNKLQNDLIDFSTV